jgi:hypothetical protein
LPIFFSHQATALSNSIFEQATPAAANRMIFLAIPYSAFLR